MIGFHPSITSTILTMWIVDGGASSSWSSWRPAAMRDVPGRLQNLVEFAYEVLDDFARRPRRRRRGEAVHPALRRVLPAHPVLQLERADPAGRPDRGAAGAHRATSTSRSASPSSASSTSRSRASGANGVGGYLGKFFPVYEFKHGVGAGIIALFVGLIELMLEFVKPVTLAMRLFGNIYGGEVALGVMTALTIGDHPGRHVRPGAAAQLRPGPDLQRPDPHVHPRGDREPPHEEGEIGRGGRATADRPTQPVDLPAAA